MVSWWVGLPGWLAGRGCQSDGCTDGDAGTRVDPATPPQLPLQVPNKMTEDYEDLSFLMNALLQGSEAYEY